MHIRSKLLLGAVAVGMASSAIPAVAQEGIEIITVTAAKREQNVQDVPISMNVIAQKELEKNNLADLKDISLQIPGMNVLKTNNFNTISLRGFGSSAANPAIDQTVALYMDGVFAGRAREYMAPFFDIARIEVLRGPQGAQVGKNTAAGAVSVVTNNPSDEFGGSITASYLIDRQGYDIYGYVTGAITDTLSARFAGKFVNKSNGWVQNLADNTGVPYGGTKQGRLSLHWQPQQGIDVLTKFQYDNIDFTGRQLSGYTPVLTSRSQVTDVQNAAGLAGVKDWDRQNSYHFSNNATFDVFGDLTLVSISGYEAFNSNALAGARHATPEVLTTNFVETFTQGSQEFRLLSPADQTVSWIVGVFADYSNHRLNNIVKYINFPVAPLFGQMTSFFTQSSSSYSAYATATWNVTDDLRLIGGVRGTYVGKKGKYTLQLDNGISIATVPVPFTLNATIHESYFDPSATIQYDVTDDIMVYASYAKGSKGGTLQGANRAVTAGSFAIKPEISTNYEIGFKSVWWDWLTVNVSAYILDFKNLQGGQYTGTPPVLLTKNVGSARSQGVEMVLGADFDQWIEGLKFNASGNYIDARYTEYLNATCTFGASPPLGTCVNGWLNPPANTVPFNGAGLQFGGVPAWAGSMEFTYTRVVMDGLKLDMAISADMQGKSWIDAGVYNPNTGVQPANTKFHFRIGVGGVDDEWSVALIGRNVFNVLTTSAGVYTFPPYSVWAIDELQAYSVQASLKF